MSKAPDSALLERFLGCVENGQIIATDVRGGAYFLEKMTDAIREILAGVPPDTALHITRVGGRPAFERQVHIAYWIYLQRNRDPRDSWDVIEAAAEKWLAENEYPPLSKSALKRIHNEYLPEVKSRLLFRELCQRLGDPD